MSDIQLKPVSALNGLEFFIPEYQRGYRWKTRQVLDLLEDLYEFMKSKSGGSYCLQPLVVINDINNKSRWNVVDGQQRLTTLFILMHVLGLKDKLYKIEYQTRKESTNFLNSLDCIDTNNALERIDNLHIYNSYIQIEEWFKDRLPNEKDEFKKTLLENTEFIWYECDEKDPIEVFTRLNIGKISLTNSELVKALFLSSTNFRDGNTISQEEIAVSWDRMEYELQKDEFWCFIHEDGYDQPTRIDFILELLMKRKNKNSLPEWSVNSKILGNDQYRIFRFYYHLFKNGKLDFKTVWNEVKTIFDIFVEWYNDNECYHYIGFLVHESERKKKHFNFDVLMELWEKSQDKDRFKKQLQGIRKGIKGITGFSSINSVIKELKNLDKQYELDSGDSKTACYPLLFLFNIQSIVNKNNKFKADGKFDTLDFERFPFNLFKKEKGWDIEHIAPNTCYSLPTEKDRLEYLKYAEELPVYGIKSKIRTYILKHENDQQKEKPSPSNSEFDELRAKIERGTLNDRDRNKVWNFCLLDQSTNRSYGNSIFALKRKEILFRERGLDKDGKSQNVTLERRVFIPICTLNAFTKFYSPNTTNLSVWSEDDAKDYRKAIAQTLQDFKVTY